MVQRAAAPKVTTLRKRLLQAAQAMTSPLLPDDYLGLLDPRWSTREATGTIVRLERETDEAATVLIKPSHGWSGHVPGQYLRIGAEIDGVRQWRAYSITSDPSHREGLVSITVKHVEDGLMSPWLTERSRPGSVVFLGEVEGTFGLPDPVPAKLLCMTAGSGITPVMSMLRELDRRGAITDVVHVHCARTAERFIFGDVLRSLSARSPGYDLRERLTGRDGRFTPGELDALVPDWRERESFLSGPGAMIDAFEEHYRERGSDETILHVERFQPVIGHGAADVGSGGSVSFRAQHVQASCGVGVSILVGGEEAGARLPYGCRMGICHTCVGRLRAGRVRDLRSGELSGDRSGRSASPQPPSRQAIDGGPRRRLSRRGRVATTRRERSSTARSRWALRER